VIVLTVLGTLCCIAVAFLVDSYSLQQGWRWGANPVNNVLIPLLLAPPFFFYLLSKLRQLAIANSRLLQVASTDNLTSCLSRAAFTTLVDAYLSRVSDTQARTEGALLVFDVDHFKSVNDRFGHDQGDEALKLIVQKIKSEVRDIDLVGRMGGEEFAVFLPGVSRGSTMAVAERIRASVREINFRPRDKICVLSISIGVVTFMSPALFHDLYRSADQQLYEAKRNGRDRVKAMHLRVGQSAVVH
jgi:diguanylate cyclase (GGDEF)-like protein